MKKYKHIGKLALAASLLLPAAEAAAQGIHIYTKDGARHAYPLTGNPEEKLVIEPRDDDGAADKGVLQWLQADGHYGLMLRIVRGTAAACSLFPDPGENDSCTVFALDDEGVNEYLATCPFVDAQGRPVRSVEQLTIAQKERLAGMFVHEGMHTFSQLTGEGVAAARSFLIDQWIAYDYFVSIKTADDLPAVPPCRRPAIPTYGPDCVPRRPTGGMKYPHLMWVCGFSRRAMCSRPVSLTAMSASSPAAP